ncbi:MAG: hypothetical protein L0Y54_14885, partial [Sporichthyaceae bacterium]|nr:hypothetical protein [Sporichthyaceae bacterium]
MSRGTDGRPPDDVPPVTPGDVAAYLAGRGWAQLGTDSYGQMVWDHPDRSRIRDSLLRLPPGYRFRDDAWRAHGVIREIAHFEDRSTPSVIHDINAGGLAAGEPVRAYGAGVVAGHGRVVMVEARVGGHARGFALLGLPPVTVETRDRVRAALVSSGHGLTQNITVSVYPPWPAGHRVGLDLALGAAVLAATGDVPGEALRGVALIGELDLDGRVRPMPTVATAVSAAAQLGFTTVVVAAADRAEAEAVPGIFGVRTVDDVSGLAAMLVDQGHQPGSNPTHGSPRRAQPTQDPLVEPGPRSRIPAQYEVLAGQGNGPAGPLALLVSTRSPLRALEVYASARHSTTWVERDGQPIGLDRLMSAAEWSALGRPGWRRLVAAQVALVAPMLPGVAETLEHSERVARWQEAGARWAALTGQPPSAEFLSALAATHGGVRPPAAVALAVAFGEAAGTRPHWAASAPPATADWSVTVSVPDPRGGPTLPYLRGHDSALAALESYASVSGTNP